MAVPIVMPRLGDFMMEGTVSSWVKPAGEHVSQGEVIAAIETEKVNYDLEATESGILHPAVQEGANVAVDGVIGYLLAEGELPPETPVAQVPSMATPSVATAPPTPATPRSSGQHVPSSPGARRLAANLGIDISLVEATGPRGRVVEADIRTYAERTEALQPQTPAIPPGLPTPSKIVPVQGMRKAIAEHMRGSITSSAQLSYFLEVDVTEVQRLRREASKSAPEVIALAHVLVKACAEALKRVPMLNTVLASDSILHFDEINVGVAVALDDGLIVPIIRNVQDMDVFQISAETQRLATNAREGKLSPDDVVGGTFTISVLGAVDGFTPILNRPQNALLGAGRTVQKPVVRDGEIVVRETMTLSLTADHQVVDGAVAAGFLRRLQQIIERPHPLFSKHS